MLTGEKWLRYLLQENQRSNKIIPIIETYGAYIYFLHKVLVVNIGIRS